MTRTLKFVLPLAVVTVGALIAVAMILARAEPESAERRLELGMAYEVNALAQAARESYEQATTLDPSSARALYFLAVSSGKQGEMDAALEALDRVLDLEDTYVPAHLYRGQWSLEVGRIDEAAASFRRATELDPTDFSLIQDYAVNFFASETFEVRVNWKEAMSAWAHARTLAKHPDEVFYTWLNEARAAIKGHNYSRARTCLEEALKLRPDSRVANDLIGKLDKAETT